MSDSKENTKESKEEKNRARVLEKHEYTIQEELGRGISGTAFMVNSHEGETYVIKEMSFRDMEDLNKIKKEVEILKSLKHPYIVTYEESFEDEEAGLLYIVMEYCAGGDLYKKMQSQGKNGILEEQQILDWCVQICQALQYLHENNVLHRDIKPQNIFLTEEDYINLGDFGCSKAMDKSDVYAKSVVGADLYVSPEVLEHHYDFKTDIWSLGWLLHDLCMLNVWSDIKERRFLHAFSMKGNPPPISERYSEELRELIRQMLSCDPEERPSAAEILAKPFLKDAVQRNRRTPEKLEQRFMKATEIFEETDKDLKAFLTDWEKTTDSMEEIHRKCTIGSLSGSVIGAAGGITALVGTILIPFTFGASIIVTAVGAGVAAAGGVTSGASNITNAVKQKALRESLKTIVQKYENVSEPILNSSEILCLLRKIQTFRIFARDANFDNMQDPWWVNASTFTSLCAARVVFQSLTTLGRVGAQAGVQAAGQTAVRTGVQAGGQAVRVGRAAAAAAEAVVAVAAVSGVLSGLLIIADAVFIGLDSREIHQMNQGQLDDPQKVKSSVLKGIAQMRNMLKVLHNILEEIKKTREELRNRNHE